MAFSVLRNFAIVRALLTQSIIIILDNLILILIVILSSAKANPVLGLELSLV